MNHFRRYYGASPFQLLLMVSSFAVALYAGMRLLRGDTVGILVWFAGSAVLHDLVLLPLYSLADQALIRVTGGARWVNHVRVPAFVSGVLALVWWPLIFMPPAGFESTTGLSPSGRLQHWLLITAVLFGASALLAVVRALNLRHRRRS